MAILKYLNEANPNNLLKANRIKRDQPSKMASFVYETEISGGDHQNRI